METTTKNNTAIIPVEEFKSIIEAGPTALSINQDKITKASRACERLLEQIRAEGMNDELDAQCNSLLIKLKNTLTDINERRKPLTEIFDRIRKAFTELEAKIDPAKKDSIYALIQSERNKFATVKIQEQKRRQDEADRKLAREREVINLKAKGETTLRTELLKYLENAKKELITCFEGLTLANWDKHLEEFEYFPLHYRIDHYNDIKLIAYTPAVAQLFTVEEIAAMNMNVKTGKFEPWAKEFQDAMVELHNDLTRRLASKKTELTEIANAKGKEAKRLQDEANERQRLETERIEREAKAATEKATAEVEAGKNVELTNSLFDNQVALQDSKAETKAIENYEIEVKNNAAWLLIINLYFTQEGLKEDSAKLEKKTLGSMKKFAESHCKKTGEKIESPYIVYTPVYSVRTAK